MDPRSLKAAAEASVALLERNLTPAGILAATAGAQAEARNYTRIFGRDAAICALGMLVSGSARLRQGAVDSLLTLAEHQADNGQIPKFVDPDRADADFWYLGCIDATLWWLIAVDSAARQVPEARLREELQPQIRRALAWLRCQEHPRLFLLQQNEASDWADIMPRSGFVLYTNALWYYVKRLYGLPQCRETRHHFNHLFWPFSRDLPEYRRLRLLTHYVRNRARHRDLYLSFVNFSFWGEEGDVFGNLLAVLFGLAEDAQAGRVLRAIVRAGAHRPYPVRAVLTPIAEADPLWRTYMGRHRQNLRYQYHNGGSWPFIGAFLAMALAARGRGAEAQAELVKLAEANAVNDWEFNEWFHGESGVPSGMPGQSWNAAMFLLARHSLSRGRFWPVC